MKDQLVFMGVDIGTTTSKGVLVTPEGKIIASAGFEHGISRPRPDWAEHDADQIWWGEFVRVCRLLLEKSGVDPKQIASLGFSTMYPTLVPVDKDGRPLRKGILYGIDRRALAEIEALKERLGDGYCLETSGNGLSSQSIAPKVLWIRNHEPEVFAATHKFLNASAYIAYRLTGRYCMDHASASLGGVPYRLKENDWDDRTLEAIGVRREQLPQLVWANEIIGGISSQAAEETGLAVGTPVTAGTGDHVTESLSQGYVRSGVGSISYGTTFGMDICTDRLMFVPGISTSLTCFPGLYTVGGGMLNGCSLTRWFRDQLAVFAPEVQNGADFEPYSVLNEEALAIEPGSKGLIVLPYFAGEKIPFFDPTARGMVFGMTLEHTRQHIYRALMEGVAYSVRHTLECVQNAGLSVEEVISTGGGTSGRVWTQIVSDVTGLKQQVLKASHGSPVGAAFLGALAAGYIADKNEILNWNETERWVEPNPENRDLYDRYYHIFRELYSLTSPLMGQL